MNGKLANMPHPAIVCSGPQLDKVIAKLEAGTYPQPEDAIWRGDLPHALAVRLAKATGATDEQIAEITAEAAQEWSDRLNERCQAAARERDAVGAAEPEQGDSGESATPLAGRAGITIRHDHENGTLVHGTSKGDGVYELIGPRTAARFRYFPSIRMIGIAQSRDQLADRWRIGKAAEILREHGHTVTVEIDDTPRDMADVKADRADRLDTRYERLTAKAERNAAEAEARFNRAEQISERFAGGQPILVGHHSERRARADHKRMDNAMRAGVAAADKADRASYAASRVGLQDARRERPDVIIRRIAKNEAELRKVKRSLVGRVEWQGYDQETGRVSKPRLVKPEGEWLEQCEARKTYLEHHLAADREALEAAKAAGYTCHSRETIHAGDVITRTRHGSYGTGQVLRANPKTVSVKSRYSWADKVSYEDVLAVLCPHDNPEVAAALAKLEEGESAVAVARAAAGDAEPARPVPAPPPPVRPAPARVERPAEPVKPLEVSASYELFATPAAIVAEMIEAGGVEPGMTVLEPSAGTGAIAGPLVRLGATVDTYELNASLSGRLKDLGVRNVYVADFPGVPQRAEYDAVLMNPPFKHEADIKHVTHALGFLRPGGVLVAIMSAGVHFRTDKTAETFRQLVDARGGSIARLPAESFAQSGTNVSTVMVVIPEALDTGPLAHCYICEGPIFAGDRVDNYAGRSHYACVHDAKPAESEPVPSGMLW